MLFRVFLVILLSLTWLVSTGCSDAKKTSTPSSTSKTSPTSSSPKGKAKTTETATGWGTLKGKFVYDGDPPMLANLDTSSKDSEVCSKHPVPNETLEVDDATKGIKNIVVFARKVPRVHPSYEASANDPLSFDQKGCLFLDHVTGVRVSQPLKLKNSDPIPHNTNIKPFAGEGTNPLLPAGAEADFQFSVKENVPVPVSCNIHPWMKAYILPRDDPYFAVSGPDGSFEIAKLPAGEALEFQVWHESSAESRGSLVAKPDWEKGRFELTIPADGVEDLGTISVPASAFKIGS